MKILGLFDKYFLILMIFQALIVIIIDSNYYSKNDMKKMSKKAKHLGVIVISLSIILFAASKFV